METFLVRELVKGLNIYNSADARHGASLPSYGPLDVYFDLHATELVCTGATPTAHTHNESAKDQPIEVTSVVPSSSRTRV